MRDVVDNYLTEAGRGRSFLLMGTAIVWGTIGLGIVLYVVLTGVRLVVALTAAAIDGGGMEFGLAATLWIFVALSFVLARAAREVWRRRRQRRWDSEIALDSVEAQLFSRDDSTVYMVNIRDRLAVRAMNLLETKLLGTPAPGDAGFEQRLIALHAETGRGGDATDADQPEAR